MTLLKPAPPAASPHPTRQRTVAARHILLCTAVLLMVAGCSRVQLVYRQLDWLLPIYLENYLEFEVAQQRFVDQQVDALLTWHCSTQLNEYAELLRDANRDFQTRAMTREQLWRYSERIETLWDRIMAESAPRMTAFLKTISDDQVNELRDNFSKRNAEVEDEFKDVPADEIRERQIDKMTDRLEPWFGDLNPAQQQSVAAWADRFQPMSAAGLDMRKRWQQALLHALDRRDSADFDTAVSALFLQPYQLYTDAYRERLKHNWDATIDLLYRVGEQTNDEQLATLSDTVDAWSGDFEQLACAGTQNAGLETGLGTNLYTSFNADHPPTRNIPL